MCGVTLRVKLIAALPGAWGQSSVNSLVPGSLLFGVGNCPRLYEALQVMVFFPLVSGVLAPHL